MYCPRYAQDTSIIRNTLAHATLYKIYCLKHTILCDTSTPIHGKQSRTWPSYTLSIAK